MRHRKGTSTLISYLNRGKYAPAAAIQANWKRENRIRKAEEGTAWYRRCLDRNRIETFQKISYKNNSMTTENEKISTDETAMIRRAMKNIWKSDTHPWAKQLCIEILTGTYKNQRRRMAILAGILDKEKKDINSERVKKGLNKKDWGPNIYEKQKDPERHCVVCGEAYSDETLHYFF